MKKQRRWLGLFLCLALMVTVGGGWAVPAQADAPATATLPWVTLAPDAHGTLSLDLDASGATVVAIDLRLTWDPQVVRVDDVALGDLATGWIMSSNRSIPGELRVSMAGTTAISGMGALIDIDLVAVGAMGTRTSLAVAQCALNEGAVACTASHGQVSVSDQPPAYQLRLPLVLGWNLVSLPVTPNSLLITDVLASIEGQYDLVMAYDPALPEDPWRTFAPDRPAYVNDLAQLDAGQGFWLKTTDAVTLVIEGEPAQGDLALAAGWNLVGYRSQSAAPVAEALANLAGQYDVVCTFDAGEILFPWKVYSPAADPQDNDLTELVPGRGYWILMNQPSLWPNGS